MIISVFRMKPLLAAIVVPLLALAATQRSKAEEGQPIRSVLWASISVQKPIFREGTVGSLQVSFGVVNDGTSAVNPNIGSSHLLINGVEPPDWPFIINNGIRSLIHDWLPPGRFLQFGYALGEYFQKPGVYTLEWYGEGFKAPKITFRVLPLEAYRPLSRDEMK